MLAIMMSFVLAISGIIPTGHVERISSRSTLDPEHVYVHEWRYDYKGNLIEENRYVLDYTDCDLVMGDF